MMALYVITSAWASAWSECGRISSNHSKARRHCLPLTHALMMAIVRDHVCLQSLREHLLQQLQGALPLLALPASADGGVVRDHVCLESLRGHLPDTSRARCHCLPFSQELMVVLYVITSSWVPCERISCNRSRARRHCLPFLQALVAHCTWSRLPGVLRRPLRQQLQAVLPLFAPFESR